MKNKMLIINMVSNIISFMVSFAISFFLSPYIINNLGADAYGFYPLANNFVTYAQLLVIALNSMAARFITIKIVEKDLEAVNGYYSSVFYANIVLSAVLSLPLFIVSVFIDKILDIPVELVTDVKWLFIFTFISLIVSIFTSIYDISMFTKNKLYLKSYKEIIQAVVRALILVVLFSTMSPKISFIGISTLGITLIAFIFSYIVNKKLQPELKISIKNFRIDYIKQLLQSGVWNSFNQLSSVLLLGLDLLMANIFLGATSAGEYSIAQMMPNLIRTFLGIIISVFIPQLIYKYAEKNIDGLVSETKKANKIIAVIAGIPIALIIGFGDVFFKLWQPSQDSSILHSMSIIILLPIVFSISLEVLYSVNTILNKVKVPSIVLFITGVINVIMVVILINTTNMGIFAIPVSSAILSVIRTVIFTPIYTAKQLNIKWWIFYPEMIRSIAALLVGSGVFLLTKNYIYIDSWFKFIIVGGLCCLIVLSINILIIMDRKELKYNLEIIKGKLNTRVK